MNNNKAETLKELIANPFQEDSLKFDRWSSLQIMTSDEREIKNLKIDHLHFGLGPLTCEIEFVKEKNLKDKVFDILVYVSDETGAVAQLKLLHVQKRKDSDNPTDYQFAQIILWEFIETELLEEAFNG